MKRQRVHWNKNRKKNEEEKQQYYEIMKKRKVHLIAF